METRKRTHGYDARCAIVDHASESDYVQTTEIMNALDGIYDVDTDVSVSMDGETSTEERFSAIFQTMNGTYDVHATFINGRFQDGDVEHTETYDGLYLDDGDAILIPNVSVLHRNLIRLHRENMQRDRIEERTADRTAAIRADVAAATENPEDAFPDSGTDVSDGSTRNDGRKMCADGFVRKIEDTTDTDA